MSRGNILVGRVLEKYILLFLKSHLVLLLLLTGSVVGSAQNPKRTIDSLRTELQKYEVHFGELNLSDSVLVNIYCGLASHYQIMGLLSESEQTADTAIKMSEELYQDFSDGADQQVVQRLMARSYANRGLAYFSLSMPDKSLKDLIKAESFARMAHRYKLLGTILCYKANCYGTLLLTAEAKACLNEAKELCNSFPNVDLEINIYSNMASLYTSELNPDSALYYMDKAIGIARAAGSKYSELVLLLNSLSLGKSFNLFNYFEENLDAAKSLLPEYGGEQEWSMYYIYQALWDLRQNRGDSALNHLDKAYALASKINEDDALESIYEIKATLYASLENWDSSSHYFREYQGSVIKSINIDRIAEISTAESKFNSEKNELIAKEEIQRQRSMKWFAGVGLVFISVVAFAMYRLWRKAREASDQLREKNNLLERSNVELKNMQFQLVNTEKQREADRVRVNIARDIHDEIGSGLTKIGMLTEVVKKNLVMKPDESERQLLKIAEYSRRVNASLSEIVWAVNPTHDSTESLIQYSKNFAIEFLRESDINIQLEFSTTEPSVQVKPELKRGIFMVLKESLNNVVKYSGARNIDILFIIKDEKFQLKVSDDGVGFNTFEKMNIGNGLMNMQSRMSQLGCHFAIFSEQGKGCSVEAWGNVIA